MLYAPKAFIVFGGINIWVFSLKRVKVKNEEISPKVLTAALFSRVEQMPKGYALKERYVYDYEFELFYIVTALL